MANHICSQIGQLAMEIIRGQLTVYYAQVHKYLKATGTRKLAHHLCSQIGQAAREIIVEHVY